MDRIIATLSPVRTPNVLIYKDGITEVVGGITMENFAKVINEICENSDIQKVDIYGNLAYTEKYATDIYELNKNITIYQHS